MKGSAPPDPVYKPTPISLLDSSSFELSKPFDGDCSEGYEYSANNSEDRSLPVYNPTPLSELAKHIDDDSPSIYSPLNVPAWPVVGECPTYSPVVKRSSSTLSPESISVVPFYKPSPAYPPDVETPPVFKRPRKHTQTAKPTITPHFPTATTSRLSQSPSVVPDPPPKSAKRPSTGGKDDADEDPEEKHKKIISLYRDLYEDDSEEEEEEEKKSESSSHASLKAVCSASPPDSGPTENIRSPTPSSTSSRILTRPKKPLRPSNKIPMPIRIRYLDQFIEACLRISPSESEAYILALNEEQSCHDKAANRLVYLNAVINSLKAIKAQPAYSSKNTSQPRPTVCTSKPQKRGQVEVPQRPTVDLDELVKGPTFYQELQPFLLSEDDLNTNRFPRPDTSPNAPRGRAVVPIPDDKKAAKDACAPNQRFCCRCGQFYAVNKFGEAVTPQTCIYHWGKPINQRVLGGFRDMRYTCCQAEVGQQGCQVGTYGHVSDINKWCDLDGYVSTLPALPQPTDSPPKVNVYALDCEMVYTTGGCELARVTLVDPNLSSVYDQIVQPDNPIVDPNTRFSGLKLSDFDKVKCRLTDIQLELLHLIDEDTILIGHSLESDLVALKLIHNKVVDTSIVFPHRLGLPYKRALRTIAAEVLQQIIQQDEAGHDSREDAIACMRLMQHQVKEAIRKRLRTTNVSSSAAKPV
uniref:RNA exonuclease 1 homolog n=1 Tax=Schistocephalus solidus TaxID=70667 RepID=A0A0X3NLZ0_SCHSO